MVEYIDKIKKYVDEGTKYVAGLVDGYTSTIASTSNEPSYLSNNDFEKYNVLYKSKDDKPIYLPQDSEIPEIKEEVQYNYPKEKIQPFVIKPRVKIPEFEEDEVIKVHKPVKMIVPIKQKEIEPIKLKVEEPKASEPLKIKEQLKQTYEELPNKIKEGNESWYNRGYNDGKKVKPFKNLIMILIGFLIFFSLYIVIEGFGVF